MGNEGENTLIIPDKAVQRNTGDLRAIRIEFLRRQRVAVEILCDKNVVLKEDRTAVD